MSSNLTSLQFIGEAEVMVEFVVIPGESGRGPECRDAGPGCDQTVGVTGLYINGEWVDSRYFAAETLRTLADSINEELLEAA